jgi:hypothetical protein
VVVAKLRTMCECNGLFGGNTGNCDCVGIQSIVSEEVENGVNVIITLSNGTVVAPIFIANGSGDDGQGIDHVSFTSSSLGGSAGQAGATDTYTVWGDLGEIISLGTFTVYNGTNGTSVTVNMANVGSGANVYKTGTNNPYNFRSIVSSDSTIEITQNTDEIDLKVSDGTWSLFAANLAATGGVPGIPYIIGDFISFNTSLAVKRVKNKVYFKGILRIGSSLGTYNPTGSSVIINTVIGNLNNLPGALPSLNRQLATVVDDSGLVGACLITVETGGNIRLRGNLRTAGFGALAFVFFDGLFYDL